MADSTTKPARAKPTKPRPDFPLYPHAVGKWAKTIRGKTYYFGTWDDPETALRDYLDQKDDLYAGRVPKSRLGILTVRDLCNDFLRHCKAKLAVGEMVQQTLQDYTTATDRIVRVFGKNRSVEGLQPEDFAKLRADIAKTRGPVALGNEITRVRTVLNYAKKNLLIHSEVRFGMSFQRPSKKTLRQTRAKNGKKMFDAADCRRLIDNAHTPELKAMVLLALNCGFGNSDCAKLPLDAVDLKGGWIRYARPKTGVERRSPLWEETVKALREVLSRRERRAHLYANKSRGEQSPLLFLTKFGTSYEHDHTTVSKECNKLIATLDLSQRGRGFYAARHTFRTVADGTRDFPAIRLIMGHTDDSMDAVYTELIEDSRLRAVVAHVRAWLWPQQQEGGQTNGPAVEQPERRPTPRVAISDRRPPVAVEYDSADGSKRLIKVFNDAYEARRFWAKKERLGKHPRAKKVQGA